MGLALRDDGTWHPAVGIIEAKSFPVAWRLDRREGRSMRGVENFDKRDRA